MQIPIKYIAYTFSGNAYYYLFSFKLLWNIIIIRSGAFLAELIR